MEKKEEVDKTEKTIDKEIKVKITDTFQESFSYLTAAECFSEKLPYFYDKNRLWWIWNEKESCWIEIDEIDLLNGYVDITGSVQVVKSKIKGEMITAMQMIGRRRKPKQAKDKYIQFKDKVINIEDNTIWPVESRFFFTNPIPWEIGTNTETPTMDKLFTEWVGPEYVKTLYEIIAYCCYRKYPIQVLFCFIGGGCNGKTQFLKIIDKFIGTINVVTSDLDLLVGNHRNRFESFKLYKKLVCEMGETNFGILNNTGLLKKLTGGDKIGFEKKRADAFDDYSYAKILISTNSLPTSEDTSEGFYRRWLIIDFPNQFSEGKDIVDTIPNVEYNNLCLKVCKILPVLLKRGSFTNQGSIIERKHKFTMASNPLPYFINTFYERGDPDEYYVRYGELYKDYILFLSKRKRRIVSYKEFKEALMLEGLENRKTWKGGENGYFVEGIRVKQDVIYEDVTDVINVTSPPLSYIHAKNQVGNSRQLSHLSQLFDVVEPTFLPCYMCGEVHSKGWTLVNRKNGYVYCDVCAEGLAENENNKV